MHLTPQEFAAALSLLMAGATEFNVTFKRKNGDFALVMRKRGEVVAYVQAEKSAKEERYASTAAFAETYTQKAPTTPKAPKEAQGRLSC